MIRKIIKIDEDACNGCGLCVDACHESAIILENGKAKLSRDDYCDGLGNCLPVCPTGAITFEEREAAPFDEAAVLAIQAQKKQSPLSQWPVQIKLVPVNAPYFNHANLLIAADCTAFAYRNFHKEFIENHITLIGCPKLDEGNYADKLAQILSQNTLKSITVVRMEVPCCGGIEYAVKEALKISGVIIPWKVVTISVDGKMIES